MNALLLSNPIMTDYNKLTVVKLKDVLKERGLPLTGLKAALVARLVEDDQKIESAADDKDLQDGEKVPAQPEEQAAEQNDTVMADSVAPEQVKQAAEQKDTAMTELVAQGQVEPVAVQQDIIMTDQVMQQEMEQASQEVPPIDPQANAVKPPDKPESPQREKVSVKEAQNSTTIPPSSETEPPAPIPSSPALPEIAKPEQEIAQTNATTTEAPSQATQAMSEIDVEKPFAQTQESNQTSVDREEVLEDTRKRKRRSQSPPPSSIETAVKKAKTLDGSPRATLIEDSKNQTLGPDVIQTSETTKEEIREQGVAEDVVMDSGDTNVPDTSVEGEHDGQAIATGEAKVPSDSIEDERDGHAITVEDTKALDNSIGEGARQIDQSIADKLQSPPRPSPTNAKFKGLFAGPPNSSTLPIEHDASVFEDRDIAPALHPATTALYIRNFMRPLHPGTLKEHLENLARSTGGPTDQEVITEFFLDSIKTHCLVQFSSISSASRVRLALHERVWPDERTRKALWVDYVPEEKIRKWVEVEQEAGGGRGARQKRWEVVYEKKGDDIAAYLQEADGSGPRGSLSVARASDGGRNAPVKATSLDQNPVPPVAPRADYGKGFKALDDLFKSTGAKPKLYFQPVSASIVNERLDRLAEGRGGGRNDEMRRFTFEKNLIVDNGSEYGAGWRGGGRGRGGYSRGYSGRGGYSGDSWGRDYR